MYFWISVGSNIEPEHNMGRALEAISEIAPMWWLYPPAYTQPIGIPTTACFINTVLVLYAPKTPDTLKTGFEQTEIRLGRDRDDPDSSRKDRVCDIDILAQDAHFSLETQQSIEEPYLQPVLQGVAPPAPVEVFDSGLPQRPSTVYLDGRTRHIRVLDNGPQPLIDWVETTF